MLSLLALQALAGCSANLESAYVVSVFLETDTDEDHEYVVSVLQDGNLVESRDASATGGFPFRTILMSPSVEGRDAEVRIDEAGGRLASRIVKPQECPSGEVAVTIVTTNTSATIQAQCT